MLFLLFGASAAGKTTALNALRRREIASVAMHDFDEIGVPVRADITWRQASTEAWVRRAAQYQARGVDLILAGQVPLGEVLAAPSAPRVRAIAACLIDCDDETRVRRLQARGPRWFARCTGDLADHLTWAAWMRRHADDSRWSVRRIDTSTRSTKRIADDLVAWMLQERELVGGRA